MVRDRAVVLAACATVLFAATVLAALVGYSGSVTRDGLRRTLERSDFDRVGTRVTATVPGGGWDAAQGKVRALLKPVYRDVPLSISASARSDSYALPGGGSKPDLTVFATYGGIEAHARLVAGSWPAAGADVQAVVPSGAAKALKLGVGDTLTLRGRVDRSSVVKVRVSGIFSARSDDYFWRDDRLAVEGVERLGYTTYGPLVVRPEVFARRFTAAPVEVRWKVLPDLGRIDAGGLTALGRRAAAVQDPDYRTVTGLPDQTEQLGRAVLVARSTMLMPVLQLMLLAGYALVLVARLLADHRRAEVALLRTRGASLRQIGGLTLAEGLLIAAPGALFGPLLAGPLLALAGRTPAVRAAGLRLDAGPLGPLWVVSVAAAVVCALLLAGPTLNGASRTFVEAQSGIGRPRRGALRGTGADLALLVVAGIGVWQLTRYGGAATGSIDPLIVSAPALALLAGGTLLLRLVPATSRLVELATARGRGLAAALGARQVGRRRLRYTGPALLLIMAMAVGVLSVTTMATWRSSQLDQADFQAGTDLRVAVPDEGGAGAASASRYATLPGVTGLAGVYRQDVEVGTDTAALLAVDARRLAPLLRVRPSLERDLRLGELPDSQRAALAVVPGRPRELRFDVRAAGKAGGPIAVWATMVDGRGHTFRADLKGIRADGRTRTVAVPVAAGTAFPLALRGMHFPYDDNAPNDGTITLEVTALRGDGGAARPPAGAGQDVFVDNTGLWETQPPKPVWERSLPAGDVLRMRIPAVGQRRQESWAATTGATAHAMLTTAAPPAHAEAGSVSTPAPVAGVVTAGLAERARVKRGGTVTVGTAYGSQPVRVVGVVPALPGVAGRLGVLVDLPALADHRAAVAAADPGTTRVTEWWMAAAGGRTGPAAAAVAADRSRGEVLADRAALRHELRDAPLGVALQGALILGFVAALAFAVVAFTVNATVAVQERGREFTVLRALGVRPGQVAGMLAVEQAFLVGVGVLGGLLLGLVVAWLDVPHIVLTVQAGEPYPPADLIVPWPLVAAMAAGVTAVLALVLAPLIAALRRRGLGADLREGDAL
ncbi:FtsX-like permease family protein [Actinomadura parmotrematis]|uniref:FtsX-like permease family protein n=1 Tax=Actinomadura parmotrematis TaxID=2864039 RepID=A0ABS7FRD5_9ACTN|nr:FtsX-like permease family protein [Actinomadura parmotrematis]MBW8482876.1 FtsX-like permease family protein [Actinomadura parmotrematis]